MAHAIQKVSWSVVHRPNDVGIDLPAGASARNLEPADYHPVEMGPRDAAEEHPRSRTWLDRLIHPHRRHAS
jgi:hypothetical protein